MKIQKSLQWSDEFAMKKKDNFKLIFLQKKPKFLWKVVISWISEPWNQKMPLSSLFIAFLYINFVKNLDFCLKFSSKKSKILWKIVKSINAMNFPFSLRWIFIARIFFIAMNSLLAYMYSWNIYDFKKNLHFWLKNKKGTSYDR